MSFHKYMDHLAGQWNFVTKKDILILDESLSSQHYLFPMLKQLLDSIETIVLPLRSNISLYDIKLRNLGINEENWNQLDWRGERTFKKYKKISEIFSANFFLLKDSVIPVIAWKLKLMKRWSSCRNYRFLSCFYVIIIWKQDWRTGKDGIALTNWLRFESKCQSVQT